MEGRYAHPSRVLGSQGLEKVRTSKVLVVGAGGIGCELVKNLVLSGFEDIEMIDLDTIDASNLNRQFLFRSHHVSKSKAEVAKDSALRFNPNAKIVAYHGNVKDNRFDCDFFRKFNIVLNGLDNRSARSHVNRMAMKAGVPLVESGTMGFNGQVQPLIKNVTECYDCQPKQADKKSFAVCTIHQQPTSMVHCTHYAKEFYKRFFGEEVGQDPEMQYLDSIKDEGMKAGEPPEKWVVRIFNAIFDSKIRELMSMKDSNWAAGRPPNPLAYDKALSSTVGKEDTGCLDAQKVLPLCDLSSLFVSTFVKLWQRCEAQGRISWDKDDPLALSLTVAVANLRAYNFNIKVQSEFDVKSIAGNIIPAIATSNAIIAGGIVLEAFKILTGNIDTVRFQSLRRFPARIQRKDCYIVPEAPPRFNPRCYVCQSGTNILSLELNIEKTTVRFVVDNICGHELSLSHPMVSVSKGDKEKVLYEDEEMEDNADKVLTKWIDIADWKGWSLKVEDMLQDLEAELVLTHNASLDPAEYKLVGNTHIETGKVKGPEGKEDLNDNDDDVAVYHPRKKAGSEKGKGAVCTEAMVIDNSDDEVEPHAKRRKMSVQPAD
eukprot:Sspe_Gene.38983::Locus_18807_Transcript_1_1_Confidence_1.000_Length_2002::g.38983::m.38983/K10685/UBLE1B, SAE2, UBA2; ubiquitin-like 1-activating enzyme E1 B